MKTLLTRASLRYLRRHPPQAWLALLGIALGVGVVVAVDLAVGSADQAFQLSAAALEGRTTDQIAGGPNGLNEGLFTRLHIEAGIRASAPRVEGEGRLPRRNDIIVRLLGIDPISDTTARALGAGAAPGAIRRLLTVPRSVLVSARTADHLQLAAGAMLQVLVKGHVETLCVAAVITPAQTVAARGLDDVLVMDIASAQELLGMQGQLSGIDLSIEQGPEGDRQRQRIQALLPAGAALLATTDINANLSRMTESFRLNLHAMSLLGLVVGIFLIYNAVSFSVMQRRPLWAALRALGVTRGEIFAVVLHEAVLFAAAGIAAGIALGYVLGHGLVQVVLRTINDLYFTLAVIEPPTPPLVWVKGAVLGAAATLGAAALPAWQAAHLPVTQVLRRITAERQARHHLLRQALLGLILIAAGTAMLAAAKASLALAFMAVFTAVIGYALLIPFATRSLMRLLHAALARNGLLGRMAARGVILSLSRTGMAVAALAVVISVSLGMAVMIDSFRATLSNWLQQTLQADIYVSAAGPSGTPLAPEVIAMIKAMPEVAAVSTGKRWQLDTPRGITEVSVLDPAPPSFKGFRFKLGNPSQVWPAFLRQDAVLISEPYAMHHGLRPGDTLPLRTEQGEHPFTVAGVYYDYGSDQGVVTMSRATYQRWWHDRDVSSLGIYLRPSANGSAVVERLRTLGAAQRLSIRPSDMVREAAMTIFDRTFAVTRVLQAVALLVAAVGVVGALAALQLDRGRELGVLRSIGVTQGQLWGLVAGESLLMGLAAGLFALPLGLALGWVLINVIQAQAFGWTLTMSVGSRQPAQVMLLALAAAAAAGIYPAWRMSRLPPLAVLREE